MWSLFRRNAAKPIRITVDKLARGFVHVKELDFFGPCSNSPNGHYLVAWSDSDRATRTGGFRTTGSGSFLLACDGVLVAQGVAERPNHGKVSNTGVFILNDWMFGNELKGTFRAYAPNGTSILNFRFAANLYNNGISEDGQYAVCQLCSSSNEDSGALAFFDLANGHLLWKRVPKTGWADNYTFRMAQQRITLNYDIRGAFDYDFSGNFLDQKKWDATAIDFASGYELHLMAKAKLSVVREGQANSETLEDAMVLLKLALARGLEHVPKERAGVHRTIGEIYEHIGNYQGALAEYETAISINPNIGLKRKVTMLRTSNAGL